MILDGFSPVSGFDPEITRLFRQVSQLQDRIRVKFDNDRKKIFGQFTYIVARSTADGPNKLQARAWDIVLCYPNLGAITVQLPDPASCKEAWIGVKNDSDSVLGITVISTRGTLDGAASYVLHAPRAIAWFAAVDGEWKLLVREELPPGTGTNRWLFWDTDTDTWVPGTQTPRLLDTRYSPVGLWWLGNVGGEDDAVPGAVDHSGNGFDLTVESGSRRYMYIHPALGSVYMDGSWNLYRDTFESELAITGDMSFVFITIWDYITAVDSLIFGHVASGETSDANLLYALRTRASNDGTQYIHEHSGGTNVEYNTPNRPVRGQLTMVGGVRENDVFTLYLNGREGSPPQSVSPAPTGGASGLFRVGGGAGFTNFKGNIAQLAVYPQANTADQMLDLYNWVLGPQYGFKV